MKRLIAILSFSAFLLFSGPVFAQYVKPDGVPQTIVPGNITIAVFASAQAIDGAEYVGIFEQHTDLRWYWTGQGTVPITNMSIVIANAGGVNAYLANVALPVVNADILKTYYGQTAPPVPPAPGSDPIAFLNYGLVTAFTFKAVNGVQAVGPK